MCSYCLRERENPRRPQQAFSKLYQHFRVRGHPYGLQDTLSTLRPSCSSCVRPRLRHGRKTRYGWVARPYPTRTFTLQETPSLSWRDNARLHLLPEAGARHERRLEAVRCKPWLGAGTGTGLRLGAPACRPLPTTAPGRWDDASGAHRLAGHALRASGLGWGGYRPGTLGLPPPAASR